MFLGFGSWLWITQLHLRTLFIVFLSSLPGGSGGGSGQSFFRILAESPPDPGGNLLFMYYDGFKRSEDKSPVDLNNARFPAPDGGMFDRILKLAFMPFCIFVLRGAITYLSSQMS